MPAPHNPARVIHARVASPGDLLAIVPHLLGFYPSRSLIVLGLGDQSRVMVTLRYDLEQQGPQLPTEVASHAASVLDRERLGAAVLIGYGPDDLVAAVTQAVTDTLLITGVQLQEVLRADTGRYWSLLCRDPHCCPPEGTPWDPATSAAGAAFTAVGSAPAAARDSIERSLEPADTAGPTILLASTRARQNLQRIVDTARGGGHRDPQLPASRAGRRQVQRAIRTYRAGGQITRPADLAFLAVVLQDLRVRDDAWTRLQREHADNDVRLWTDVTRHAAPDSAAAPAALLAFSAWQAGNGALASIAAARALAAEPGYTMAQLISDGLRAALPPSAARLPLSPAVAAASYTSHSRRQPGAVLGSQCSHALARPSLHQLAEEGTTTQEALGWAIRQGRATEAERLYEERERLIDELGPLVRQQVAAIPRPAPNDPGADLEL
jgi:Domain of unknown function (DUF4192)